MSTLTTLALQNASTLRAFRPAPTAGTATAVITLKDLAEQVGRDRSSLSKALTALEEAGYLAFENRDPIVGALTGEGLAMVEALDRADGVATSPSALPDGFIAVRHDQIGPDPENARKTSGLSPEAIQDMADSLFEKGVLQQPELRRNPNFSPQYPDEPEYLLTMGERRWRGWERNIELGRWTADKLIVCKLENRDEIERLEAGLVENLQRADISNLEMAEGFLILHDQHGRTPQRIAQTVGKTSRFVQIAIKVAREATIDDKAKFVESEKAYAEGKAANLPGIRRLFTWEDLRNTVKTAKYVTALEKRNRLTLMVAELAMKTDQDVEAIALPTPTGDQMLTLINVPPGGGHWGEAQDLGVVVDHREDGQIYGGVTPVAREWLGDAGFDKDPRGWVKALALEVLGPMPVKLAEEARILNTQFLNPPKPPPAPIAAPEPAASAETSPPMQPPARDAFADQIRQVLAEDTPAPPPSGGPNLTPEQFMILVEVAHKITASPVQSRGGAIVGCEVTDFHSGPQAKDAQELVLARMLMFGQSSNGAGFLAILPQAAWTYLGGKVDDEALEGHRHENLDYDELTAFEASGERYMTTWLRAPVKVSTPKPATDEVSPQQPIATSPDDCPACHQARANAKAAGHKGTGVCFEHAAYSDDDPPFAPDEEKALPSAEAINFLGEEEAVEEPEQEDDDPEFDIAAAFAGRWDFIVVALLERQVVMAQMEPFGLIAKDEADGYAVGETLAASGRFTEVKLYRRSGKLLVHWGAQ